MDFAIQIATDGTGSGQMSFDKATDGNLANNAWLSVTVERGRWFFDPTFGSRLYLRRRDKNTANTVQLAIDDLRAALQWLLDTGKAVKIDVIAERDAGDRGRMNALVTITGANGEVVSFLVFVGVV